jgi:hypothetical protein
LTVAQERPGPGEILKPDRADALTSFIRVESRGSRTGGMPSLGMSRDKSEG